VTRKRSGVDSAACAQLQTLCNASSDTFSIVVGSDECKCLIFNEYYLKNQEKSKFYLRHAYKVQDSWTGTSYQLGSSSQPFYTSEYKGVSTRKDGKLLTKIQKTDGTLCTVGGRSEYLPEHGDIGGSVEDWLACGDYTLDSQSENTRSFMEGENMAPHLRTTGVKIQLEMMYSNQHPDIQGDVATVCVMTVLVTPAWNSRTSSDYTILRDATLGLSETRLRYRYAYGITFSFKKTGSFSYMNPYALLSAVVNVVVLLGAPTAIVRIIALFAIGTVSKIYRSVLRHHFNIKESMHGLAARMMVASMAFRALTGQMGKRVDELKPMEEGDIKRFMFQAFNVPDDEGSPGDDMWAKGREETENVGGISRRSVEKLAEVVYQGLDVDAGGDVDPREFMKAVGSEEHLSPEIMLQFFGKRGCRLPTEILFDPTRSEIQKSRISLQKMKTKRSLSR